MSRECISIHVGQAGCQIGSACWELFCAEHGIQPDGHILKATPADGTTNGVGKRNVLFSQNEESEKWTPRALLLDLDPSVIDSIKCGAHRDLFHSDQLIKGNEDAANNYTRARHVLGRELCDRAMDCIRKMAAECSSLQGFLIYRSYGGGTGTGVGDIILERLATEYPKKLRFEIAVFPSPKISTSPVECYNAVFAMQTSMEHTSTGTAGSFFVDNEALYDLIHRNLNVESVNYPDMNHILAQLSSTLTASLRFDGSLNLDLNQLETNLISFPRLHYIVPNYSPLTSAQNQHHEQPTVEKLTHQLFNPEHRMLSCDIQNSIEHLFTSCCLLYRGKVSHSDANSAVTSLKESETVKFIDFGFPGFKVGLCDCPPVSLPETGLADVEMAVASLSNTAAIKQVFGRVGGKFDQLYSKRAFVHWFVGVGIEDEVFDYARKNLLELEKEYEELIAAGDEEYDDDES